MKLSGVAISYNRQKVSTKQGIVQNKTTLYCTCLFANYQSTIDN